MPQQLEEIYLRFYGDLYKGRETPKEAMEEVLWRISTQIHYTVYGI